jgi:hypothetical protein
MGIYDQIHGECPHCGHFNGRKKGKPGFSGFQIKTFIDRKHRMTYDYYVGDTVPNLFKLYVGKPSVTITHEECESCKKKIRISCAMQPETLNVIILPFEKC